MGLETFSRTREDVVRHVADTEELQLTPELMDNLNAFGEAVQAFEDAGAIACPNNFAELAWPSYLAAVMEEDNYFSIEQVALMADLADVRVLVLNCNLPCTRRCTIMYFQNRSTKRDGSI